MGIRYVVRGVKGSEKTVRKNVRVKDRARYGKPMKRG